LTCQVDVGQENLVTTSYSLNSADISTFASTRKSAIEAADVKYYKDREDAYAKKDKEFVRLAAVKISSCSCKQEFKEVSAASANYQKAYKAASELWKKELVDASTNRVLARDLAQKNISSHLRVLASRFIQHRLKRLLLLRQHLLQLLSRLRPPHQRLLLQPTHNQLLRWSR
jgi:hypothetical protein